MAIGGLSYSTGNNEDTGSGSSSSTLNNGGKSFEPSRISATTLELTTKKRRRKPSETQ